MKTTTHTTKTIASTLAEIGELVDALHRAHDVLTLPETDDAWVDWGEVITHVDAIGQASHRLATCARESMIPALKVLKTHAQAALAEIARLDAQLAPTPAQASPGA